MSTKTNTAETREPKATESAEALAEATADREAAEASHAEALAALEAAQTGIGEATSAVAAGTAGPDALTTSAAALDAAKLRVEFTADAVTTAQNVERSALAHDGVGQLRPALLEADRDAALKSITSTLTAAVTKAARAAKSEAEAFNEKVNTATARARAAGLVVGKSDPALPITVTRAGVLVVEGVPLRPVNVAAVVDRAIADALDAAGVRR